MDVEFERVPDSSQVAKKRSNKKKSSNKTASAGSVVDANDVSSSKNLFDLSLGADNKWNNIRVPFCMGQEYIDAKLAFTIDMEGTTYGIGVPFDDAVAIIEETPDGVTYIRPDRTSVSAINEDDENEELELMEIFAKHVKEGLGEEFNLLKTPKVLTISGGLDKLTENWQHDLVPEPSPAKDLLEEPDETLDDLFDFFKSELGEEEFEKTMNDDSELDPEIINLFEGDDFKDIESNPAALEALMNEIVEEAESQEVKGAERFQFTEDGLALKLLSFYFGHGKRSYSIVKLLEPYALVGRYRAEEENEVRFDLLPEDEEAIVVPKLEKLCRADLEKAGLKLGQ